MSDGTIEIRRSEQKIEELPPLCMACGAAHAEPVFYSAQAAGEPIMIPIPLCDQHRHNRDTMFTVQRSLEKVRKVGGGIGVIGLGMFLFSALGLGSGEKAVQRGSKPREGAVEFFKTTFEIGKVVALVGIPAALIALAFELVLPHGGPLVAPLGLTVNGIRVAGVCPGFVEALQEVRRRSGAPPDDPDPEPFAWGAPG